MTSPTFATERGQVVMLTDGGPYTLTHGQCDRLLDIFEEAEAVHPFNQLYTALLAVGGIERCCCLRERAA